ncbi:MAG: tail protein X [Shimia sp.]
MRHRASQGEMVDRIAFDHYGDEAMAAAIYDANPGLAVLGPRLPIDTIVELPEKEMAPIARPIRLWGRE